MSIGNDVKKALEETKYAKTEDTTKLDERWKEYKEDRVYATRIAKRDEAIAFAKYRKLKEERGSDKN